MLSTEKMTGVIEIDEVGGTAIVEAGTVVQTEQETVALGHMADGNLHFFVALMEDGDFHTASESGPEQHPQPRSGARSLTRQEYCRRVLEHFPDALDHRGCVVAIDESMIE